MLLSGRVSAICALAVLVGACGASESGSGESHDTPRIDAVSLDTSVSSVFLKKYRQVTGFDEKLTDRAHCSREDDGTFDCELETRGLGGELWGYRVHANASSGCWTATTFKKYGAHQSAIEAYQKDEFLAPSKKDAARYAREARALRRLKGCIDRSTDSTAQDSDDPAKFIEGLAAQSVKREFGRTPASVTCKYLGKEKVALAPDSNNFDCVSTMRNGRRYIDKISCFKDLPLKNYESCGSDDGYPRKPLRPVP